MVDKTDKGRNPLLGICLTILAFLGFSVMSGFVKAASHTGIKTQQIMFFQNVVSLIVILPWVINQGKRVFIPKYKGLVIGRALLGVASMYMFFLSVRLVPLVNAVLLQNTVPIFIPIIAFVAFRKKITLKVWSTILIGFIGVVFVLNPGRGFLRPGDLLALSAGFLSALVTIIVDRLESKNESVPTIMFYYIFISVVVTGLLAVPLWTTPHGIVWVYLISAGLLYAFFQLSLVFSLKYASAVIIAPFIYLSVVFSGLVDWVAWKQAPDGMTIIGTVIVIAGAIFSASKPAGKTD